MSKAKVEKLSLDDLVVHLSAKTIEEGRGVSKAAVRAVLDVLAETVPEKLKEGVVVTLPGLAKFESVFKDSAKRRNPKTGEEVITEPKYVPKITAVKPLKEALLEVEAK